MNYVTMTAMRNHRLRQAYRREREQNLHECAERTLERVLSSPVKAGFFVSVDHVLVMERRRQSGKLPPMHKLRRQMWDEIFLAFDAYRAANPKATLTDAACNVIARATASRFFITPHHARHLVC